MENLVCRLNYAKTKLSLVYRICYEENEMPSYPIGQEMLC
jgi:hypothetical protein